MSSSHHVSNLSALPALPNEDDGGRRNAPLHQDNLASAVAIGVCVGIAVWFACRFDSPVYAAFALVAWRDVLRRRVVSPEE
jgi:hypothetical protein